MRASIAYFPRLTSPLARSDRQRYGIPLQALRRGVPKARPHDLTHVTRAYRPRTSEKAERFIQSALREWAYGIPYSTQPSAASCSGAGPITTTGIDCIKALEVSHPCLGSIEPETTS